MRFRPSPIILFVYIVYFFAFGIVSLTFLSRGVYTTKIGYTENLFLLLYKILDSIFLLVEFLFKNIPSLEGGE